MKLAVMQPYFFPYIGYWQLIAAVDKFVILDDVHYIMRGYINRNSILLGGKAHTFSIPVSHASQNKLICDTKLLFTPKDKQKFLETVSLAYRKAPYYANAMRLIEKVVMYNEDDLTKYIANSIELIKEYLGIETPVVKSSDIKKDPYLKGEERIIALCKTLGAETYINPPGGRALYSHESFDRENIDLLFLDTSMNRIVYPQFGNEFIDHLSIIDFIMFNDVPTIRNFLTMYSLNPG